MSSPTVERLSAVWGSGPADVHAVGVYGTILHYGGTVWTQIRYPTSAWLAAVWGSGPADVIAAGSGGTISSYTSVGSSGGGCVE